VVNGFLDEAKGRTFGRPVGVAVDRFGALIIADDVGDAVWRVTPAGWHPTGAPPAAAAQRP
jgi:glucose/arabinose dehydrogenase